MMDIVANLPNIDNSELAIKEYDGKRVVTFKDIDKEHQRPEGTAKANFNRNKEQFVEGTDFYKVPKNELSTLNVLNSKRGNPNLPVYLLTQSGYLMIVKSFTDKLSWQIQRQLVDNYFNPQSQPAEMQPEIAKPEETKMSTIELPPELQMLEGLMNFAKSQYMKNAEFESDIQTLKQTVEDLRPREIIVIAEQQALKLPDIPNVKYTPKTKLYTATAIANAFGISPQELNRMLYAGRVQSPKDSGWIINKKYENDGLVYQHYGKFRGNKTLITYWTIKGKEFICALLRNQGLKQNGNIYPYDKHAKRKRELKKSKKAVR